MGKFELIKQNIWNINHTGGFHDLTGVHQYSITLLMSHGEVLAVKLWWMMIGLVEL